MPRLEEQITIARAAADLFRLCHDVDRRPEWDSRVAGVQILTPQPLRRGAVVRTDTIPAIGGVFSWEGEYTSYSFPSRSKVEVLDAAPSSTFVTGSEAWRFDSSGTSTLFTLIWDYKPRGILGRISDALVGRGSNRRAIKQSLANLKRLAESET